MKMKMIGLAALGLAAFVFAGCGASPEISSQQQGAAEKTATTEVALSAPAASTDVVQGPYGAVPKRCWHQVPEGGEVTIRGRRVHRAEVDVTNNVATNGSTILARYDDPACDKPPTPAGGATVSNNGDWYATSTRQATTTYGLTQYNLMHVQWQVPPALNYSSKDPAPVIYLFPALQNFASFANGTAPAAILQPILQHGSNGGEGGNFWSIAAMAVRSSDSHTWVYGGNNSVNPGDVIDGWIWQAQSSPDAWYVTVNDNNTNLYWYLYLYNLPNTWPKFNAAYNGALEGYSDRYETRSLTDCFVLPGNPTYGSELFTLLALYQAGPTWSNSNDVTGSNSWQNLDNPKGLSPGCGAWASTNIGYNGSWIQNTSINWQN
jgi:hypothetical protein